MSAVPERHSKRRNKGPKNDRVSSTVRRPEGAELLRGRQVNLDVPASTSLYTLLREWSHDSPFLFPDLFKPSAQDTSMSFQYRAPEMTKLEAPVMKHSSESDFESSIREQDANITIDSHVEHWQDVQKYWMRYYENRQVLAENGSQLDQMIQGMSAAPAKLV